MPGIREMLIFPTFYLLFQVRRGCLRPCRFFTLHGKGWLPPPGIRPYSLSFSSRLRCDNDTGAIV
ncbi:hypothetical protein CXU09_00745 [Akkermansia muciniphila]|uniref:Uncharacterized protein n=1 Tax=Akkermansia muciniphila TaxID=239935 RepID=A0AAP8NNF6_9BACT|nr:hypothetical protein CXU09_00745 [Akkermansia muciniphila]